MTLGVRLILLTIAIVITILMAYTANSPMVVNEDAIEKINQFKLRDKFTKDGLYTGLGESSLNLELNEYLNEAADDFIATVQKKGSKKDFQNDIKVGLAKFDSVYLKLDTEDRERVATSFEKLMNAVGLKSSNGQLNKWMYGFNPDNR